MPNPYGLTPYMSYAAIAEALGLSTNEVRRLERRALTKLYRYLIRNDYSFEVMSPAQRQLVRLYEPD